MIREFINQIGGPKRTAEALRARGHDVTEKAVIAWGMRDTIPWKWRQPVAALAQQSGAKTVPEELASFAQLAGAAE